MWYGDDWKAIRWAITWATFFKWFDVDWVLTASVFPKRNWRIFLSQIRWFEAELVLELSEHQCRTIARTDTGQEQYCGDWDERGKSQKPRPRHGDESVCAWWIELLLKWGYVEQTVEGYVVCLHEMWIDLSRDWNDISAIWLRILLEWYLIRTRELLGRVHRYRITGKLRRKFRTTTSFHWCL